jgi:hypothetical protein
VAGDRAVLRLGGSRRVPGLGRPVSRRWQEQHGGPPAKPGYGITATGVSHRGAGCTLGDIVAEWAVFWLGGTAAGITLGAEYIGGYLAAIALGIVFSTSRSPRCGACRCVRD